MHHDPDKFWITDPDLDHPKGTQPKLIRQRPEHSNYCTGFCIAATCFIISGVIFVQLLSWHESCSDKIYIF